MGITLTTDGLPVEAFLDGYPDEIRAAAETLRAVVRRAAPEAIERVRPGWRLVGYDLPFKRRTVFFAFVIPELVHVHLGFEHGIFMADPHRRLEGAHLRLKKVRFVTFEPGDAIPVADMETLVREAARLAAMSREERLALALDRDWAPGDTRPRDVVDGQRATSVSTPSTTADRRARAAMERPGSRAQSPGEHVDG